ncbi:MAG: outer membrane beta-barrel protein [Bdellovibrionota bacterium]
MRQYLILPIFTFIFSITVQAESFKRVDTCGSASVTAGSNCETAKVEFKFDGCLLKSQPQFATKVICEENKIRARYQAEAFRYEAQFEKEDNGWGNINWKSVGTIKQWKNTEKGGSAEKSASSIPQKEKPAAPAAVQAAEPAKTPSPSPTQESSTSLFKLSGFFDFRFSSLAAKDDTAGVPNANAESGFGLEDGAFIVNYEKDRLSAVIDIAFRRLKDSDVIKPTTSEPTIPTVPNESQNSFFAIGVDKSQAYIKYKITPDFIFDFGQFDTIYGVELNDSKDRVFGKTGIVYDYTLPVTHTGAMFEYSTSGYYAKVFAANPNNKGSFGTSSSGDNRTEHGAALGYSNDLFRTQFGYMTRLISKADGSGYSGRSLLDITAGVTLGAFTLDFEFSKIDDPNKNTLTPTDSADTEKAGQGYLALMTYKISDPVLFGLRYEQVKDDPLSSASTTFDTVTASGASIHYKVRSDLELRTEYVNYQIKYLNATTTITDSRFNVAALFLF